MSARIGTVRARGSQVERDIVRADHHGGVLELADLPQNWTSTCASASWSSVPAGISSRAARARAEGPRRRSPRKTSEQAEQVRHRRHRSWPTEASKGGDDRSAHTVCAVTLPTARDRGRTNVAARSGHELSAHAQYQSSSASATVVISLPPRLRRPPRPLRRGVPQDPDAPVLRSGPQRCWSRAPRRTPRRRLRASLLGS